MAQSSGGYSHKCLLKRKPFKIRVFLIKKYKHQWNVKTTWMPVKLSACHLSPSFTKCEHSHEYLP